MLVVNLIWLAALALATPPHPMKCFEVVRADAPEYPVGGIFVDMGSTTFVTTDPRFNIQTELDSIRVHGLGFRPVTISMAEAEDIPACNVVELEPLNGLHDY
jgi:hypothetical protein